MESEIEKYFQETLLSATLSHEINCDDKKNYGNDYLKLVKSFIYWLTVFHMNKDFYSDTKSFAILTNISYWKFISITRAHLILLNKENFLLDSKCSFSIRSNTYVYNSFFCRVKWQSFMDYVKKISFKTWGNIFRSFFQVYFFFN